MYLLPLYFVIGFLVSLLIASVVILSVVGPMTPLLMELCGGEARGKFWARLTSVLVVLSAMLLSLFPVSPTITADVSDPYVAFWIVVTQLKWALAGIIASVIVVAIVIGVSIAAFEQKQMAKNRASATGSPPPAQAL